MKNEEDAHEDVVEKEYHYSWNKDTVNYFKSLEENGYKISLGKYINNKNFVR
jgi:hypothetical protein